MNHPSWAGPSHWVGTTPETERYQALMQRMTRLEAKVSAEVAQTYAKHFTQVAKEMQSYYLDVTRDEASGTDSDGDSMLHNTPTTSPPHVELPETDSASETQADTPVYTVFKSYRFGLE